jgi:hypothetical protein
MATRTWIGGGNNKASNPQDWSPTGAPAPSDTLQVSGPGAYTINVRGDALAGDTLGIADATVTLNLAHDAAVTTNSGASADVTFNLSRGVSDLDINGSSGIGPGSETVNLARDAIWVGTFNLNFDAGPLATTAGPRALFINDGASSLSRNGGGVLAVPVAGKGSIDLFDSNLEVKSSVGANQSVFVESDFGVSVLTIDHPHEYHASTAIGFGAEIDLVGLAHADSYSYLNDILKIYSCDRVIDTLKFQNDFTAGSFAVVQAASAVQIVTVNDPTQPPAGALPVHT